MTIDDESSIYIGGLPYEATEQTLRRVFDPYGHVIAVKIINDRGTRGKCYGFVTFEDPRSAIDAIGDMDGRTIGGRVVRVNGVKTRGGRSDFDRESFQQESESGRDWDRGRDRDRRRERDHDHERERFRDRSDDRLRDHDRSREYDSERERGYGQVRDHDRARDGLLDRDQDRDIDLEDDDIENSRDRNRNWRRDDVRDHDRERDGLLDRDRNRDIDLEDDDMENSRNRNQNWGRDHDFDSDRDREMTRDNEHGKFVETDSKRKSRKSNGSVTANGHSREIWSNSNNHYNEQVEEELLRSTQRLEELKREIMQTEEGLEHTGTLLSELQQKSKKLEDLLIDAKKTTSYRKTQLTKLHKCFLQVEDYTEKLKSSERELQTLVDGVVSEDIGNAALRGGIETDGNA